MKKMNQKDIRVCIDSLTVSDQTFEDRKSRNAEIIELNYVPNQGAIKSKWYCSGRFRVVGSIAMGLLLILVSMLGWFTWWKKPDKPYMDEFVMESQLSLEQLQQRQGSSYTIRQSVLGYSIHESALAITTNKKPIYFYLRYENVERNEAYHVIRLTVVLDMSYRNQIPDYSAYDFCNASTTLDNGMEMNYFHDNDGHAIYAEVFGSDYTVWLYFDSLDVEFVMNFVDGIVAV